MTPELLAIKRASGELVKGVGGLEAAAGFCRVGKSTLSDAASVNKPGCFLTVDVVQDLEPLARERSGWPHVTRALAAGMGFALVQLPEALPDAGDLLRLLAEQSKEAGDVANSVCVALADGKVEPHEARHTRQQIRELITVAVAMDAMMGRIMGERQ